MSQSRVYLFIVAFAVVELSGCVTNGIRTNETAFSNSRDFEARFAAAKIKDKDAEIAKYIVTQARRIRTAAMPCVASMPLGSTQIFRFVADISPDGALSDIQTDQESPLTACFRRHISSLSLAPPPKVPFVFGARINMLAESGF